jgi:deoxyribonuclease V
MQIPEHHEWDVSVAEARRIQTELAARVTLRDAIPFDRIRIVAGVDNGYVKHVDRYVAYAAVTLFTFPALEPLGKTIGEAPVVFPYVPGFLTFREGPAILDAFARLAAEPDVILLDGQGYAHPRRIGLATHIGVVLDRPTIGCAKSRLVGQYEEPAKRFGASSPLVDRGEVVGAVLRTVPGHDPLFVSAGNRISVEGALAVVLACCREGAFLPLPTGSAHDAVTAHTAPLRRKR